MRARTNSASSRRRGAGAVQPELVPAGAAGGVGQVGADLLGGGVFAGLGPAGQVAVLGGGVGGGLAVLPTLTTVT